MMTHLHARNFISCDFRAEIRFDAEIDGDLKEESWSAIVTGDEKLGHFTVNIPASAAIGRYSG